MLKRTLTVSVAITAYAALVSCVDHRPLRTEVYDENIYLSKDFLTRENPHKVDKASGDSGDHAWLLKTTLVKLSTPAPNLGFYMGYPGTPRYVRFQTKDNRLELVYDKEYAPLVKDNSGKMVPPGALPATVLQSWPAEHVDIKYKDNLDGERTNVLSENKEAPWKERQYVKVQLDKAGSPDLNMIWWAISDYYIGDCLKLRSVSMVPDSFEIERDADKKDASGKPVGDDYISWTIALNYELAVFGGGYYCGDMYTSIADRTTFTYHVKYSLWRVPKSDYKAVEVAEKAPIRRTVTLIDTGPLAYYDYKTGLAGGKSHLIRFDPEKEHTFYFDDSWPDKYKDHFKTDVKKQVDALLQGVGAKMRIHFKDRDWECKDSDATTKCTKPSCSEDDTSTACVRRKYGDPRYSFMAFHDQPQGSSGIGGMATWAFDPYTGEIYASYLNMYNWGANFYVNILKEYLKDVTKDAFDDKTSPLKTPCKEDDTVPIDSTSVAAKYQSSLYTKLVSYMNEKPEDWVPTRTKDFETNMRLLLPELRFMHPGYNPYVSGSAQASQKWFTDLKEMEQKERAFLKISGDVDRGKSPFGAYSPLTADGIKEALQTIKASKDGIKNHFALQSHKQMVNRHVQLDMMEPWEIAPAVGRSSRRCLKGGKWETPDAWATRILDQWWKQTATHEFGHDLGLGHNFYGSLDKPHFENNDITSSIMEYSYTMADAADTALFKPYDRMALKWIYGGDKYTPDSKENWLFCDDGHTAFSPFCTWHDIGTTPSEIIKNEIDKYEWFYKFRNFRAYRKFWNTGYSYYSSVLNSLYPMRRFLHTWGVSWYASGIKNDLMLLGVKGDENFFTNLTDEFNDEMGRSMRLVANFYKAILQQSAAERSYATKFDNFYGDITQQGIINDKYYAMLLFLGLWPIDDYDQNIYAYMAFHEYSLGNSLYYSDCQDVVDSMVGGQYDVYPWFKPLAVLVFAQDTANVNFSDKGKQKWIEMMKFERTQDMIDVFGFDPRTEALKKGNDYQVFKDTKGEEWVYYYMVDRNLHLVANKNRNPTAYKIIWDQNESININKSGSLDDYTLKYYLDYYHYFN